MELTGAVEAARARCSPTSHPSTSQPLVLARRAAGHHGRVFLRRNCEAFCRNGAGFCSFTAASTPSALSRRYCPVLRTRARAAENETEVEAEVSKSEATSDGDAADQYLRDLGIDEDGNITDSLPEEFLERMKDGGNPPNYWLAGVGLTVAVLARKSIWAELKRWGKLAFYSGVVAVDLVVAAFVKLLNLGGKPLALVIANVTYVVVVIENFFRFIAGVVPPGPVLLSVILSSTVLVVGESVSDTYSSSQKQFPSRNILDFAAILGLAAVVGVIPEEVMLFGLAAITVFLLLVRKVNPVAGFTPAAAVFAAVSGPIVRYPVLVSFIGSAVFRYWKLGYLSQGAVPNNRTAEYPRVLTGLLYLVAVAFVARSFFHVFDFTRAAISVAKA